MKTYFNIRDCCPACKTKEGRTLLKLKYSNERLMNSIAMMYAAFEIEYDYLLENNYLLIQCSGCGLVYQKEIPNESLLKKIYNEWIDLNTISEAVKQNVKPINKQIYLATKIINMIRWFGSVPNKIDVLDYGMGSGSWCKLAQGFGCNVYGHDIAEERMAHARTLGINVLTYDEIQNHRFDFINAFQVFEHVDQPLECLTYLAKSLKKGGAMQLSVPNGTGILERLEFWGLENQASDNNSKNPFGRDAENSLNPVSPFEHINCYDHEALFKMAEKSGLSPIMLPITIAEVNPNEESIKSHAKAILKQCYHSLLPKRAKDYYRTLRSAKRKITSTDLFFVKSG